MTGILTGENTAALCMLSPLIGAALSALYDITRIRRLAAEYDGRRHLTLNAAVIFVGDVMFSAAAAVIFSVLFYRFSYGAVRIYALTLAALGFCLWRMTLGRLAEGIGVRLTLMLYRFGRRLCMPLNILIMHLKRRAKVKRTQSKALRLIKTKRAKLKQDQEQKQNG